MRTFVKRIGALGAAAMMMSSAMPASASCWGDREVSAAQVREMQTVLMVATLRCRAAGIDIGADYDGFVNAQQAALSAANLVIKKHFAAGGGTQRDYDRFATSLANGHGDDETTQATCAEASALAHDGAAAIGGDGLMQLATMRVFPAALPGGTCGVPVMAKADPAKSAAPLPPIVMASAPPPVQTAVMLPSDVVAAMTVLARYHAAPTTTKAAPVQVAAVAP